MTLKELFKKVETYNEVAELMSERKAAIHFTTCDPKCTLVRFGDTFKGFADLRKYVRENYTKEFADMILKSTDFEFDADIKFEWADYWGNNAEIACAELVAIW